jgi:multidrug efflux pump subunit AcrB
VAQYPAIAPPAISINVNFPGASAETVQTTVVQVIEQQLSGIDNLLFFDSQTTKDGAARIQLTFAPGTNADTAQVQVQNRVQLAVPRLPLTVQQQGIRVVKSSGNFLLVVGFVFDRWPDGADRHLRFPGGQCPGSDQPHGRCGRLPGVRRAIRPCASGSTRRS